MVLALFLSAVLAQPAAPLDAVLAKLDAYLIDYEPKLSELVADETMLQQLKDAVVRRYVADDSVPHGQHGTVERQLISQVAFIALPNDAGWLGFRHVNSVNGKSLDDKRSLAIALGAAGYNHARELLAASAHYNLGLPRTTNLPNLPLEFLHRRNRDRMLVRFDGTERVRGVTTTRIVFLERLMPSLIRHPDGHSQPAVARAWIDPSDGRLLRAEVVILDQLNARDSANTLRVDFDREPKLGLLVPMEMHETFPGNPGKGTSSAQYSNYRRFTTSARIVPQ